MDDRPRLARSQRTRRRQRRTSSLREPPSARHRRIRDAVAARRSEEVATTSVHTYFRPLSEREREKKIECGKAKTKKRSQMRRASGRARLHGEREASGTEISRDDDRSSAHNSTENEKHLAAAGGRNPAFALTDRRRREGTELGEMSHATQHAPPTSRPRPGCSAAAEASTREAESSAKRPGARTGQGRRLNHQGRTTARPAGRDASRVIPVPAETRAYPSPRSPPFSAPFVFLFY